MWALKIILLLFFVYYSSMALNLSAPANNFQCQDPDVTFIWEPNPSALSYSIRVSLYPDFSSTVFDSANITTTQIQKSFSGFGTRYYWQVTAILNLMPLEVDTSEIWNFTTITSAPQLISPSSNSTCQPLQLQFRWSNINNGISYKIQVATNPWFLTIVRDTTVISTTANISLPNYDTKYYWRVQGRTSEGCSTRWSVVDSFRTNRVPPTLTEPDNYSSGHFNNVVLRWTSQIPAPRYEVQITSDSNFLVVMFDEIVTTNSYTFIISDYDYTYFWRVRGIYNDCESDWSEVRRFRSAFNKPQNLSPPNDTLCVHNNVTFYWDSVPGASNYRIQISEGSVFDPQNLLLDTLISKRSLTYFLPKSLQYYTWRVRAEYSGNFGLWSDTIRFQTSFAPPVHLSPIIGDTTSITVVFHWQTDIPMSYVRIQVSDTSDFRYQQRIRLDVKDIRTDSIVLQMPRFFQKYYWRLQVSDTYCYSDWSTPQWFFTTLLPPQLLLPLNNSNRQPHTIEFQWTRVEGALTYELQISKTPNFSKIFTGRSGLTNNVVIIKDLEPSTTYYWRVKAKNDEGESKWSQIFSFRTSPRPLNPPTLVFPQNDQQNIPTNASLVWNSVIGAKYYSVQVTKTFGFYSVDIEINNIPDTFYVVQNLDNQTEYFWRVQAYNDSASSPWSAVGRFTTLPQAPRTKVQLLSPAKGLTGANTSISLFWEVLPNVFYYHLQVANDSMFMLQNLVVNDSTVPTNNKYVSGLELGETYYWRVRGYNTGGVGPWSDTWWFTTTTTGFDENENNFAIVSFNPYSKNLEIIFAEKPTNNKVAKFTLIDLSGRRVRELNFDQLPEIAYFDCSGLSSGIYFLRIEIDGKETIIRINL
ncbi:MAG: fibronectin type III domain-containing protein [Candidatus Kapaibacteriales bacterium]